TACSINDTPKLVIVHALGCFTCRTELLRFGSAVRLAAPVAVSPCMRRRHRAGAVTQMMPVHGGTHLLVRPIVRIAVVLMRVLVDLFRVVINRWGSMAVSRWRMILMGVLYRWPVIVMMFRRRIILVVVRVLGTHHYGRRPRPQ